MSLTSRVGGKYFVPHGPKYQHKGCIWSGNLCHWGCQWLSLSSCDISNNYWFAFTGIDSAMSSSNVVKCLSKALQYGWGDRRKYCWLPQFQGRRTGVHGQCMCELRCRYSVMFCIIPGVQTLVRRGSRTHPPLMQQVARPNATSTMTLPSK